MPTRPTLAPPTQALPDTPAPKETRPMKTCAPTQQPECLFPESAPMPHTPPPTIRLQSTIERDYDTIATKPQKGDVEDEFTLTAYGDISLGEVIVPTLPPPTHRSFSPLQARHPPLRLHLKVRRPPMPRHRPSYTYITDQLPHPGDLELDERWPGSPRPSADSPSWLQRQPLVSPLHVSRNKQTKQSGSSIEKLFDEIIPRSPSIRLSPPGSPSTQALDLSQEPHEQKIGALPGDPSKAKTPQALPPPAPRQDKPKEAPWRTRLPPRLPIPKWDM